MFVVIICVGLKTVIELIKESMFKFVSNTPNKIITAKISNANLNNKFCMRKLFFPTKKPIIAPIKSIVIIDDEINDNKLLVPLLITSIKYSIKIVVHRKCLN